MVEFNSTYGYFSNNVNGFHNRLKLSVRIIVRRSPTFRKAAWRDFSDNKGDKVILCIGV